MLPKSDSPSLLPFIYTVLSVEPAIHYNSKYLHEA